MKDQLSIAFDAAEELTEEERKVWTYLQNCRGKDSAVTGHALAGLTMISYYNVRQIVSHLVNDHNRMIASCKRGYYIPTSPEEIEETTRSLKHRGISILARAAKIQQVSLTEIYNQACLEFKEDLVTVEL